MTEAKTDPELSPQDRLEALLVLMKSQAQANAPITPPMIAELEALCALHRINPRPDHKQKHPHAAHKDE